MPLRERRGVEVEGGAENDQENERERCKNSSVRHCCSEVFDLGEQMEMYRKAYIVSI
jgi:hypothetical protein